MQQPTDTLAESLDLRQAAQARRDRLLQHALYEDGSAGALMISEYSSLDSGLSARQAIDMLRREAADAETIYQSYVLDAQRNLLGTLSLRELILAPPEPSVPLICRRLLISPLIVIGKSTEIPPFAVRASSSRRARAGA